MEEGSRAGRGLSLGQGRAEAGAGEPVDVVAKVEVFPA